MAGPKKTPDAVIDGILSAKVSATAAAKLIGVPPVSLVKVQNEGLIKPEVDGFYVVGKFLRDWIAYMKLSKSSVRADDDSKIRKMKIRAMELEEAEKKGELIIFPDYREWNLSKVGRLAAMLASLPSRYTRDLPERKRLQKMIEDIFDQFHKELSSKKPS